MSQRTVISLIDDLDGTDADETITFGLDGFQYEIDLSTANAKGLRVTLAEYVEKGRRLRGAAAPKPIRPVEDVAAVRAWALENGYEISSRGRVPGSILAAYRESR